MTVAWIKSGLAENLLWARRASMTQRFVLFLVDVVIIAPVCYSVLWLGAGTISAGAPTEMRHAAMLLVAFFAAGAFIVEMGRALTASTERAEFADAVAIATWGTAIGLVARPGFQSAVGLTTNATIVAGLVIGTLLVCVRLAARVVRKKLRQSRPSAAPTIVVGSGNAALSLIRVIAENRKLPYSVVGCVDDEVMARRVDGVRVLGRVSQLPALIRHHGVGCVIIAIPSAPLPFINQIIAACAHESGASSKPPVVKVLPGISDLLSGNVVISRMRDVRLEDLLPREPIDADLAAVMPHLENRAVLVTGAGGSIGSELCRQIITFRPSRLLLLGHGENSLFSIEQELRHQRGFTRTQIILADVADAARIRAVFSKLRPDVVFHAAAHKHVPILENNVCEAVHNNVLGTNIVALAAAATGVAKFVLLSTDKAVNPTSVMGATKRVSELICQSIAKRTSTEFVTVRFGNVLGSRGSVLPTFKRQLEKGGPITVTDRNMERYFMTIPEAVSLVLQAMSMGRNGQVFVLDMGKPVKILHLAEMIVMLSGLTPYRDVDIVETGIRPGEKLYEEMLTTNEGMTSTSHQRLFIAEPDRVDYDRLSESIRLLEQAVRTTDETTIVDTLRELVPTYCAGAHIRSADEVLAGDGVAADGQGAVETVTVADATTARPLGDLDGAQTGNDKGHLTDHAAATAEP